jgi:hypothetical protein
MTIELHEKIHRLADVAALCRTELARARWLRFDDGD